MKKLGSSVVAVMLTVGVLGACAAVSDGDASDSANALDTSSQVSLTDVQNAIRASGANWTAGNNTVAALSHDARTAMLGIPLESIPAERVTVVEESPLESFTTKDLPAATDWRNQNGQNFVSPMLDQGRCGSCVAFATVATFETQLNIAANDPSSPFQLSPQYLFACGGGACGQGWFPSSAARYIVSKGVPDSACMPYTSGAHGDDARCQSACSDAASRVRKARGSSSPTGGGSSVNAVKQALTKGPLLARMTVYEDLMYYTGGVYKHVTGGVAGGHAVSIVGYSDADRAWIVRNSWGTGWGMNGFFEIAWGDPSGVGEETYGFDVPAPGPYVALSNVRDNALLTGQAPLAFDTQSLTAATVGWTLTGVSPSAAAEGTSPDGTGAVLDTRTVADGVYQLKPYAQMASGRVDGAPHVVYVLNGTETGAITFASLANGQTLRGTATFDIKIQAMPVPATHVEWVIKNANGDPVVNRFSPNTGAVMQLGWNTKNVPNGTYTITVTGGAGAQSLQTATVTVKVQN